MSRRTHQQLVAAAEGDVDRIAERHKAWLQKAKYERTHRDRNLAKEMAERTAIELQVASARLARLLRGESLHDIAGVEGAGLIR